MTPRRSALLAGVTIGTLAGPGAPFVELWRDCRLPASETCLSARALLPISLGVGVVVGTVVGVITYVVVRTWQRHSGRDDGA